jgi:D-sedoheptulose 7-phosphate isomerase
MGAWKDAVDPRAVDPVVEILSVAAFGRGEMDESERFRAMLHRSADLKRTVADTFSDRVIAVVDLCEASLRAGGKLMFCGNGGSAADSQHLATELIVRLRSGVERPSWPALALTLDASALTAAGNDYGFDQVFARALRGLGRRGDVLFGITTSGRSANILRAFEAAREVGIATVGLLGGTGGPAAALCDHALVVPSGETARVQECHIALGHAVAELLEDRLVARPLVA